jgi:hypothetical protein
LSSFYSIELFEEFDSAHSGELTKKLKLHLKNISGGSCLRILGLMNIQILDTSALYGFDDAVANGLSVFIIALTHQMERAT